ncbi:MAG: hypothetical protein JXA96_10640 [Sedimentisphaerales bacterium]|nr:hypothetical protein [Sedimentisphaerales bacterium]
MDMKKLSPFEFFKDFHDKEHFFEKLTSEENTLEKILSQYFLICICSFAYGIVMGSYNSFQQAISSAFKVPLLFTLSILVCFPAFYVIQHVLGSRLGFWQMLKIILSGFVMISIIMVSFSTIVIFFLITGNNYSFLKLLHVGIFGISAIFGMKTILDALQYACEQKNVYPKIGVAVFKFWILILAFVGMQLSWNLRPFIASKDMPFQIFRERQGNFYLAIVESAIDIVTPSGEKQNQDNKEKE